MITFPIENTLCDHKREPSKLRCAFVITKGVRVCAFVITKGVGLVCACVCEGGHGGAGVPCVCTMRLNIFSQKFPRCKNKAHQGINQGVLHNHT